jgi:L-cysteine/cystine lyase
VPLDLADVRAALPSLAREVYLNTGGAGPFPLPAADAARAALRRTLSHGRMALAEALAAREEEERLRGDVGALLGAPASELATAGSSTAAMNVVIWGIDWRPGDEAVTTDLEHPGLAVPLAQVARRHGVRVRILRLRTGAEDLDAAVSEVAGPRTRLVALSHVAWSTGARVDVEGASRAARRVGALVLVDGAQGIGAVPTNPRALGADAYAIPAQKWLLGPEGLGALWISPEACERVDVTYSGYQTGTDHTPEGGVVPHPAARRYEVSTIPNLLVPAWRASIRWLGEEVGWARVHEGTLRAAAGARARLEAIPGVEILTPPGDHGGLVTFLAPGPDPEAASLALAKRGIIMRWLPHPRALRVSCGAFTSEEDLDRMAEGVRALARGDGGAP